MNDITPKEAIANLNHLYGMVAPDIQRSPDVAIKAIERPKGEWKKLYGNHTYCSKCKKDCEQNHINFCGYCGADMR